LLGGADAIDRRPAWRYEVCASRDQQRLILAVSERPIATSRIVTRFGTVVILSGI
jgi:hypothetical protein